MKRYKASDLSHKRAEVIKEAKANGVIIECRNTNGEVVDELLLCGNNKLRDAAMSSIKQFEDMDEVYRNG